MKKGYVLEIVGLIFIIISVIDYLGISFALSSGIKPILFIIGVVFIVVGLTLDKKQNKSINLKQFLKPDWRKIVLTIIFCVIVYLVNPSCQDCSEGLSSARKFPIPFFIIIIVDFISGFRISDFIWLIAIITVFFYYLFSCLIFWIYDKIRKK